MSKYTIDFTMNGLVNIEANTREEALKKYYDMTWCDVIDNAYDLSEEIENIVEQTEDEPLSEIERHILDWLGYDETDEEWDKESLYETLEEQENEELIDIIRDIVKNF